MHDDLPVLDDVIVAAVEPSDLYSTHDVKQVQDAAADGFEQIASTSPLESLDDLLASAKRTLDTASLWDPLHWDTKSDGLMTDFLSTSPPVSACV